jgi:hypothetical protein
MKSVSIFNCSSHSSHFMNECFLSKPISVLEYFSNFLLTSCTFLHKHVFSLYETIKVLLQSVKSSYLHVNNNC